MHVHIIYYNAHVYYMSMHNILSVQIDGYIARNFKGQSSMLGSVLDPLADKVLISVLTVTLTMGGLLPGTGIST